MIALLAAAVAAGEPPAANPEAAPTPVSPVAVKPAEKDPTICKKVQSTGSYMSKRECHTKSEWAQMSASARQTGSRMQQGGGYFSDRPPN